jgi:hypothetical protein
MWVAITSIGFGVAIGLSLYLRRDRLLVDLDARAVQLG